MKPLKIILIWLAVMVALSMFSCTTLKKGYNENYRIVTLQKAIVITSINPKNDRVFYEGYSIPSGLKVKPWHEWCNKYNVNDTVLITGSMVCKLRYEFD